MLRPYHELLDEDRALRWHRREVHRRRRDGGVRSAGRVRRRCRASGTRGAPHPRVVEDLNRERGFGLSVRIGVNTGEVVVSLEARPEHGEGMVDRGRRQHRRAPSGRSPGGRHRGRRDHLSVNERRLRLRAARGSRGQGQGRACAAWRAIAARARFGADIDSPSRRRPRRT